MQTPVRFLTIAILTATALSGCAHQEIVVEQVEGPRTVHNRLPPGQVRKPAFEAGDGSSALEMAEAGRIVLSRALTRARASHCPFGSPAARAGLDFGRTESVWRSGYQLLHSEDWKTPYWVCEDTLRSLVSNYDRGGLKFKADPDLQLGRAVPADYGGSSTFILHGQPFPIDIGHMAPAEAHSSEQSLLVDTFYLSNAVPQYASMNRGKWAKLEACTRAQTPATGRAWVISGPMVYTDADVEEIPVDVIGNNVVIPTHTWKIFVSESSSGNLQAWAVVMPNKKLREGSDLNEYAQSIDDIEDATGFDFLPDLPITKQAALERDAHSIPCH